MKYYFCDVGKIVCNKTFNDLLRSVSQVSQIKSDEVKNLKIGELLCQSQKNQLKKQK